MISLQKISETASLEEKIEALRSEMVRIGIQEGLTSQKTIYISQELDIYITRYQQSKNNNLNIT